LKKLLILLAGSHGVRLLVANKRTAILTCTVFLLQNGYRLSIPQNENPELRQLLFDIQEEHGQLDRQIIDKIILYIRKHASKS
jgi:prophage maintenance system killer protein